MCFGPFVGSSSKAALGSKIPQQPVEDLTTRFSVTANQLEDEIAALEQRMSSSAAPLRTSLRSQIAKKQSLLDSLRHPSSTIPSAPSAPAAFGSRIEPPKVGVNDLKIRLPSY